MRANQRRIFLSAWFVALCILGCNTQVDLAATPRTDRTSGIVTLSALQTMEALTHAAAFTPSPFPTGQPTPIPIGTMAPWQNALSMASTLCREGPGKPYKVVTVLRPGQPVQIIGRASVGGWIVVQDTIRFIPCWMPAGDLQLNPELNMAALPLVTQPPTPTPTATLLPGVTPTATATP